MKNEKIALTSFCGKVLPTGAEAQRMRGGSFLPHRQNGPAKRGEQSEIAIGDRVGGAAAHRAWNLGDHGSSGQQHDPHRSPVAPDRRRIVA